jgi:hypothetical protein
METSRARPRAVPSQWIPRTYARLRAQAIDKVVCNAIRYTQPSTDVEITGRK